MLKVIHKTTIAGSEYTFSGMTVKAKKTLNQAKVSTNDPVETLIEVIKTCVHNKDLEIDNVPYFVTEALYLNIVGKTSGEKVKVAHYCKKPSKEDQEKPCLGVTHGEIDLSKIYLSKDPSEDDLFVKVDDENGVVLKYPTFKQMTSYRVSEKEEVLDLIIDYVIEDGTKVTFDSKDSLKEFIESLELSLVRKILDKVSTWPNVSASVTTLCEVCGDIHTEVLEGFESFFL